MNTYAFILGRKYLLSIAELCSVIGKDGHIFDLTPEALMASFDQELSEPQESLNRLGGTMKIAKVIVEISKDNATIAPTISAHLTDRFTNRKNKLSYGISAYNFAHKHDEILKSTLIRVKKYLTVAGMSNRFINNNYANLETAAIKGEKLLEEGTEIVIINGTHRIFIAETVAIQDFENYSHRDYDRPARDPKLGMLPPKLAQIMINLGGYTHLDRVEKDKKLYDPFVGIGTILTEGLLLGYHVIGSDISTEALDGAKKNTEWIMSDAKLHDLNLRLFYKDATTLNAEDFPYKFNLIATESYLGPPVRNLPPQPVIRKNIAHLKETLYRFFRAIHDFAKQETPIIISFLAYKNGHNYIYIEGLIEQIKEMGFKIEPLIPKNLRNRFKLDYPQREGLIYDRPDQIVCREIWKFTKK